MNVACSWHELTTKKVRCFWRRVGHINAAVHKQRICDAASFSQRLPTGAEPLELCAFTSICWVCMLFGIPCSTAHDGSFTAWPVKREEPM